MNRKQRPRFLALLLTVIMLLTVAGCGSSKGDQQDSMDTTDATDTNPASTGEGVNAKTSVTLATSGEPYRFFALSDEGCAGDDNLVLSNVYDCLTFLEADGSISEGLAENGKFLRTVCATPSISVRVLSSTTGMILQLKT